MEIQQLRTFLAVARAGSITRAAAELRLSQPAVSAQVKALEDTLELALFERTARGMQLTPEGERLRTTAERAVDAHHEVLSAAARIRGMPSGVLRLGLGANSNASVAGRLVSALGERYPAIELRLTEGDSSTVIAELLAGRLDAGFFNAEADVDARMHCEEVARFGLRLVAPAGFGELQWETMAATPWILPPADSSCGQAARALLERHAIEPVRIVEVDRESATRTLVAAGAGVGVLHDYTAEDARARGEVEVLLEVGHTLRVLLGCLDARREEPALDALRSLARALPPQRHCVAAPTPDER
ncbi:MAG: LysR family transcriptional regulator [Myxococcota bacterium]